MSIVIHAFIFNHFCDLSLTIVIAEWLMNYIILELKLSTLESIFEESKQECQFSVLINKSEYFIFFLLIVELWIVTLQTIHNNSDELEYITTSYMLNTGEALNSICSII